MSFYDEYRKKKGLTNPSKEASSSFYDQVRKARANMTTDEFYSLLTPVKPESTSKKGSASSVSKKKEPTLWDNIKETAKNAYQALNPFDDVSFEQAVKNQLNMKVSKGAEEINRFGQRVFDSVFLGAPGEIQKKVTGKDAWYRSDRKGIAHNVLDFASTGVGYLLPGIGAAKGLKAIGLGAKEETKGLAKLAQLAKEGALTGAGLSTAEVGIREGLNPNDYSSSDNLKYIGFGTAAGAIGDPLVYGVGKGLSKLFKKSIQEQPYNVLNDSLEQFRNKDYTYNGPIVRGTMKGQSVVNDPLKTLRLNVPEVDNTIKQLGGTVPNDVNLRLGVSPLELPEPLKRRVPSEPLGKEVKIEGTPLLNPPVGENVLPNFIGGGRSFSYWQKRLQEFTDYINSRPDRGRLRQEALEDLWTQFARPDEDVTLEELIQLGTPTLKHIETYSQPKGEPLQFKKAIPLKEEYVSYVGKANPEDMVTQRAEGNFTTRPTDNGVKINVQPKEMEEPLRFKTTIEPLRFKKTIVKANQKAPDDVIEAETVQPEQPPKSTSEQIQERINDINKYLKQVKNPKEKAMYEKQLAAFKKELKKENERALLNSDTTLDELLANSDQWKDKGKPFLKRETMERNFEDIMGEDAAKMKRVFLDPIKKAEAERIRFVNKERERVKTYGIKAKSLDDQLVQMYGEKKITLEELKKRTSNWKRVKVVAEEYRKKYDQLLDMVNKVLVENGFEPIPKREDYFPHYEEVDGLLRQFGFDMGDYTLPTDINGLTANFKPGKNYFAFVNRRKGDETTFGAIEGFDRYIEGVSNLIFHTPNIKRLRALEKAIRTKYEGDTHLSNFAAELTEYTNLLAGKKAMIDRAFEDVVGRKIYNFFDTMKKRVSANMVGANVASALTGYIPLTQAAATTSKTAFVRGMFDTIANVFKDDGFIHESDFLTRRIGSDPLVRTLWDKIVDKSMWMMKTVDNFTSQTIVRAKYYEGLEKGLSHEEALKRADDWAARLMADRSKGQMPTLFNAKSLGAITQFQLEVNNQISFLFKDMPRSMDKKALASAMAQVLIYSYIFNNFYEKVVGRRPAFDPIGVVMQAVKDYNNDNLTNLEATNNLRKNIQDMFPFVSFLSGGRLPITAGSPDFNALFEGKADWKQEAIKPLIYLLSPVGGGQLKRTYEGLTVMGNNPFSPQVIPGEYRTNADGEKVLKYPVEDSNANFWRSLIFGKNALPETKEFYENHRKELSLKQTKAVENSSNPKATYEQIIAQRRENILLDKINKIKKNKEMSDKEKEKRLQGLLEQLKRIREGR